MERRIAHGEVEHLAGLDEAVENAGAAGLQAGLDGPGQAGVGGLYLLGGGSLLMLIGSIWLFNLCKIEF